MISTEDMKKFISETRKELEKEKRKLDIKKCDVESIKTTIDEDDAISKRTKSAPSQSSKKKGCTRRSVSTSPLRKSNFRDASVDYTQQLQIQIEPPDTEGDILYGQGSLSGGLLDTVPLYEGSTRRHGAEQRSGSISERSTSEDIRKYCLNKTGGMLRAGEFSPNNPEMGLGGAVPRARGDVFVGLGLYEEKRRELMARRKREYRDYLAKQKQLNTIAKQNERLAMERNTDFYNNRRRTNNNNNVEISAYEAEYQDTHKNLQSFLSPAGGWREDYMKMPQPRRPSSIAVQTEDDLVLLNRHQGNNYLTRAERELSPRPSYNSKQNISSKALQQTSNSSNEPTTTDWKMLVEKVNIGTQNNLIMPSGQREMPGKFLSPRKEYEDGGEYFDAINGMNSKTLVGKDSPRARLLQDLQHTYMPSLFDEEAIKRRNMDVEKEAAAKKSSYQEELKKQIEEQHQLKEERKTREKMLEEAETRRLEEQLKLLKLAHEAEVEKQKQMAIKIKKDSTELERQRLRLQNEIDNEKRALRQAKVRQNNNTVEQGGSHTARSNSVGLYGTETKEELVENKISQLPFYYSSSPLRDESPDHLDADVMSYNLRPNNRHLGQDPPPKRVPVSSKISDTVLGQSIPVKNYNSNNLSNYAPHSEPAKLVYNENNFSRNVRESDIKTATVVNRKSNWNKNYKPNYEPTFLNKSITEMIDTRNLVKSSNKKKDAVNNYEDSLPIPVLYEPDRDKLNNEIVDDKSYKYSEAMKHVDDKWQVPVVQKNILKNNLSEDGKQQNILTQLGSIRRQLQLEQLKLDQSQMLPARMVK